MIGWLEHLVSHLRPPGHPALIRNVGLKVMPEELIAGKRSLNFTLRLRCCLRVWPQPDVHHRAGRRPAPARGTRTSGR